MWQKALVIIIVVLILIEVSIIFFFGKGNKFSNNASNLSPAPSPFPTIKKTPPHNDLPTTRLYFTPNPLEVDSKSMTGSVDIYIDSGNNDVQNIMIDIKYNPTALTNILATPSGIQYIAPPTSIKSTIQNNHILLSATVSSQGSTISKLKGKLWTISFTAKSNGGTSKLTFEPNTQLLGSDNKPTLKTTEDEVITIK